MAITVAQTISIDKITVDPAFNVRDMSTKENQTSLRELTESIKENGLFTPLQGYYSAEGAFVLTRGHRRLEAMNSLAWKTLVPVILDNRADTEQYRIAGLLLDNSGKALGPLEAAQVFVKLLALPKMTQDSVAKITGVTPQTVSTGLAVLKIPSAVTAINRGLTTHTEAYECIKVLAGRGEKAPKKLEDFFKTQVEAGKNFNRKTAELPAEPVALYLSSKARTDLLNMVSNLCMNSDPVDRHTVFMNEVGAFCNDYDFDPTTWYNAEVERTAMLDEEAEIKMAAKEKRAEEKADKEAASAKAKEAKAKEKKDAAVAKAMRGNRVA